MTRARTLASGIVIALLLSAGAASADDSGAAQALFKEGRALLQEGRFAEACDRFARSDKIDASVGARFSLGECHESMNHTASAWSAFSDAAALAMQRNDPRAAVAKKRAAALEPKLARLTIRVNGTDVVVMRNETRVDPAAFDTAVPVDAGKQVVEASAPGRRPWSTSFEIHDGELKEVRVPALEADASASTHATNPTTPPTSDDSRRTLALGLEIGGGLAIVSGLVVGGLAMSKWSSIEDTCPDAHCATNADRDRLQPEVSTARTLAAVSTVALAIGAVAVIAGVTLHVTAGPKSVTVAVGF